MEFNLYAPVDCIVKQITKCSDPTFSDKMLGDGVLIIPKSSQFFSPFDNAKVTLIFDTKHAYGFNLGKIEALLHCGLETVQLAGEPFEVQTKVGDELSKGQKLFNVDLNKLNSKKLSNETPIVFTCQDSKIKVHDFIEKEYKAGEFICKITTEEIHNNDLDLEKIFGGEGKNQKLASNIVQNVGGIKNFDEHYNCFSRLRLKILKKDLVNEVAIKKIEGVKGIHWNGNEMQIIIGQEVPKVKDEITNIIYKENDATAKNSQDKANLVNRIIKVFPAVGVPLIPILLGAGVFSLVMMLLMMFGVMPNITLVKENEDLTKNIYYIFNPNLNILFVIIFVISKSSTIWMGIGTCVSAAIYFKWNFVLAFAIGMTICSPILWGNGGPAMLGQQYDPETYIEGWVLFRFAEVSNPMIQRILQINVTPMQAKIGVLLLTIYTAKIFDDWIKKWMPTSIDFICRNLMILTLMPFIAFFIYGPIWNIFEGIFGLFVLLVTKFPLGIGMGLLSGIHQVTVVFGLHQVIGVVFNVDTMTHGGVARLTISSAIGIWAQLAALLGVIIVTGDKRLKKEGTQMFMVGAIAGITEPMLYGVNFPKKRPLYAGMIGAFAGGLIISWTNVTLRGVSAWGGLYSFIAFFSPPIGIQPSILEQEGCLSNVMNGLMFILASAVAFGVAIVVSMLIYKERVSEKTLINKMFNESIKLLKIEQKILSLKKQEKIKLINSAEIKELKSKSKKIIENAEKKSIKREEKSILKSDGAKFDIDQFLKKQEKQTLKLSKKGKHFMKKGEYDKAKEIALKISSLNDFNKLQFLESKAALAKSKVNIKELEKKYENIENKISILVKDFTLNYKELSEIDFTPIYKNAVESLLIDYNYKEEYSFKPIEAYISEKTQELAKIKRDLRNEQRLKKIKN